MRFTMARAARRLKQKGILVRHFGTERIREYIRITVGSRGIPDNALMVRTICDNLKTGVVKHPKEGDIILTDAYEAL